MLNMARLAGACLLVLCLAGQALAGEPLVLGMSADFTGSSQGLGMELYRGSMAYFQHVNEQGGVHGRQVEILAYDDQYNPTPAIENTIQLLDTDKVLLLFNYVGTPTVTRVLPLIKSYSGRKVYLFFPFTGAQPQREAPYDDYVFNLRASYRQETEGLVDHLVALGRERIAVFYQADAYGRSGWDGVKRGLAKYGLRIVGEATYRRGAHYDESMAAQVDIIMDSQPHAVISVGSYEACASFIRDARDAGLNVPIANLSFVGSENLLALLEATGNDRGVDYTRDLINSQVVPSYEDLSLPAVREYRQFMDRYNPEPPRGYQGQDYDPLRYSFVSFEGFLNAKVMVHILENLGPDPRLADLAEVTESIHNHDIGIEVNVGFPQERHQGLNVVFYTTVEDGKFVPINDWGRWAQ
ncbi:MAG: ABC transporter substrate-binding protein [Desulfovibrio sp.]|nr:MAG: ABC transporter substrate-binding protein [Desulfovibrio sp.]